MKKRFLTTCIWASTFVLSAQDLYYTNFDAIATGLTMPAGWSQYNLDGLAPAFYTNPFIGNNGWSVSENPFVPDDHELYSMSAFSQGYGTANDWLISPHIVIPSTGGLLQFEVYNEGNSSFLVYVSTAAGNALTDFLSLTPVYSQTDTLVDGGYTEFAIPLNDFAGQDVRIAIRNVSDEEGVLLIDDFRVSASQPNEIALTEVILNRYALTSTDNTLSFNVKNTGNNVVQSLVVNWNDGTAHSESIPVTITPGETIEVMHPVQVNYPDVVEKQILVEITAVNGTIDPIPSNNLLSIQFNTISESAEKRVLIEEGTGTWCGYCPRGTVAMAQMENLHPETFIGVAVHNDDPMTLPEYDELNTAHLNGFPGANVDRVVLGISADSTVFATQLATRSTLLVPSSLDATATISGDELTVSAMAIFHTVFTEADFRIGVILTEDHVQGSASGYAQTNYFSSSANNVPLIGAGHNWQSSPNPVPAAEMEYNHVARALLGGYDGQVGSVPVEISDGQVVTYAFQYTIPQTWNRNNLQAVVVLIDCFTGEVVNVSELSLNELLVVEFPQFSFQMYPNPAETEVEVTFEADGGAYAVSVTDMSGKVIAEHVVYSTCGIQKKVIPVQELQSGQYLLTIANGQTAASRQLIVK